MVLSFLLNVFSISVCHCLKRDQKSERTYIGSTIKIAPFQEGGLKKKNLVGANAVEMEHFHCYVNVVNFKDIYVL